VESFLRSNLAFLYPGAGDITSVIFLKWKFPVCSIIRPTHTRGAAMAAARALTQDGLFIGQSQEFFEVLHELAENADEARRGS
jgi:hypothetical protein